MLSWLHSGQTSIRPLEMVLSLTSTYLLFKTHKYKVAMALYSRYTKDELLLKQAKDWVQQAFPRSTSFQPNSILICTWRDVRSFLNTDDQVCTVKKK